MIRSKQENVEAPAHTREMPVGVKPGEGHLTRHIEHPESVKTHFIAKRYFALHHDLRCHPREILGVSVVYIFFTLLLNMLSTLPVRELLMMFFIYLPQVTYKAYNDAKYRHSRTSPVALRKGIRASWQPHALGFHDMHEFDLWFHEPNEMPGAFAADPMCEKIMEAYQQDLTAIHFGASKGNTIFIECQPIDSQGCATSWSCLLCPYFGPLAGHPRES